MTTENEYLIGVHAALDAMEHISERIDEASPVASLAGFLTIGLQAAFDMAPNEQAANELIRTCIQGAKEGGGF